MADNDIASLLANAAKTNADFDLGKINESYWKGLEEAYKQRSRDAFSDPSLRNADGSINTDKAFSQALRVGGIGGVEAASKLSDVGNTRMLYGNAANANDTLAGRGQQQPSYGGFSDSSRPPSGNNFPPSVNRQSTQAVAPDLTKKQPPQASVAPEYLPQPTQLPNTGGSGQATLAGFLKLQGVPGELAIPEMNVLRGQLSAATRRPIDANTPLDMGNPQVRNVLATYAYKRAAEMGGGTQMGPQGPQPQIAQAPQIGPAGAQAAVPPIAQPQQPPQGVGPGMDPNAPMQPRPVQTEQIRPPAPQVAAQQAPQAAPAQAPQVSQYPGGPTLGGIIDQRELQIFGSPEKVAAFYEEKLRQGLPPQQAAAFTAKLAAIREALKPTDIQRNAAAAGTTVNEYIDRPEKAKQAQFALEKAAPVMVDSLGGAKAQRDTIQSINTARSQLDAPGGVITGKWAEERTQLLRIAELVGANVPAITNTQTFNSEMSRRIQNMAQTLPGVLSDKDVKFLASIGGTNELSETSIRRMLDIGEKLSRLKIQQHNEQVDKLTQINPAMAEYKSFYRVQEPDAYRRKLNKGDIIVNPQNGKRYQFDGQRMIGL